MTEGSVCKNCGDQLAGKYCSACGQRDISAGITFKETVSDFLSANFAIDGPVSETLKLLATNPGHLFRNFIAGQRKSYYKPVQFFIVATVIYLAWVGLLGYDPLDEVEGRRQASANQQEAYNVGMRSSRFMLTYINYFLFLLAFAFAAVMKLFNGKAYRFAEYLAMGFYITGVYVLIGMVNVAAIVLGFSNPYVMFLLLWIYVTFCYISLFGGFTIKRLFAGLMVAFISWLVYFVMAFGIAFACVSLFR